MTGITMERVIIDGDWGGDELQLAAVLLAHPDKVEVLGATCTFGNVSHDNVYQNALRILHFLKADNVPLFKGATAPTGRKEPLLGDGAHAVIDFLQPPEHRTEQSQHSVDFILQTLRDNPAGTITITASGPLTNISQAFQREPETMKKVKQIVIMGGCTEEMDAKDIPKRKGNITPHAEFNFQQAASDAKIVMESGLPITLLPMNCTHQLTFTPERQNALRDAYISKPEVRRALIGTAEIQDSSVLPKDAKQEDRGLLNSAAHLDIAKFGISNVMHDVHCAFYILFPGQYATQKGLVNVAQHHGELTSENMWTSEQGRTDFTPNEGSNVTVATGIKNPDKLFGEFLNSMQTVLPPQQVAGRKQE